MPVWKWNVVANDLITYLMLAFCSRHWPQGSKAQSSSSPRTLYTHINSGEKNPECFNKITKMSSVSII